MYLTVHYYNKNKNKVVIWSAVAVRTIWSWTVKMAVDSPPRPHEIVPPRVTLTGYFPYLTDLHKKIVTEKSEDHLSFWHITNWCPMWTSPALWDRNRNLIFNPKIKSKNNSCKVFLYLYLLSIHYELLKNNVKFLVCEQILVNNVFWFLILSEII